MPVTVLLATIDCLLSPRTIIGGAVIAAQRDSAKLHFRGDHHIVASSSMQPGAAGAESDGGAGPVQVAPASVHQRQARDHILSSPSRAAVNRQGSRKLAKHASVAGANAAR